MIDDLNPDHYLFVRNDPESRQLTLVFSARGAKPGKFSFFKTMERARANVLYITPDAPFWYQTGLVDLGGTITTAFTALAERLRKFVADEGYTSLFVVGDSMGAYAAIVFASFVDFIETTVIALGAETVLKLPGARSSDEPFDVPEFADIRDLPLDKRVTVHMIFGEYDLIDAYCALRMRERPQFKLYSHSWSVHSVAPELHADMGTGDFISNVFRGNFFFPGRGHMPAALRMQHVESLVLRPKEKRGRVRALRKAVFRYPAFRLGWLLLAKALLAEGNVRAAQAAFKRADIGVRPPPGIEKVRSALEKAEMLPVESDAAPDPEPQPAESA